MLVKMVSTQTGSPDLFTVRRYEAGKDYDLPDLLARQFTRNGWATEITLDETLESMRCTIRDNIAKRT